MAEQLANNLWRLEIPLVGNPLKALNSYLITGERNLLIDTGFNEETCRKAMVEELDAIGVDLTRTDIFLTHVHNDHTGQSTFLHREGCKIYISRMDGTIMRNLKDPAFWDKRYEKCVQNGFTKEETDGLRRVNPAQTKGPEPFDGYTYLEDGDKLHYGGVDLEAIWTPGHTPGHFCLYAPTEGWLFSGDHILFTISLNICDWENVADSLGAYLESLGKVENLEAPHPFPSHRRVMGTIKERVKALREHHERRIAEALRIVTEKPGLTPYEIAGRMQWKIRSRNWEEFPLAQKFFAVGETVAHLDYLRLRGKVVRETVKGKNRYRAV